jgi:hypothetical protein
LQEAHYESKFSGELMTAQYNKKIKAKRKKAKVERKKEKVRQAIAKSKGGKG